MTELIGQKVKIGGIRGASFIYIGVVDEYTADVIDILGSDQYRKMDIKLRTDEQKLKEFPALDKREHQEIKRFYADLNKEALNTHLENLKLYHKRRSKKRYEALTKSCNRLKELQMLEEQATARCDKMLSKRYDVLANSVDTLRKFTGLNYGALSNVPVVDDFMSVEDDTFGGRILLIDMFINGTIWTERECYIDKRIRNARAEAEKKTVALID